MFGTPSSMNQKRGPAINPFDDAAYAGQYESWYVGPGRIADLREKRLLSGLLRDFPRAHTMLEVGCGTGHFSRWLVQRGFHVIGLDSSPAMVAEAAWRDGLGYVLGDARALPFADGAFDVVALITTLEFVSDPRRALREAVRVARLGLLLGVLNRLSVSAIRRKMGGKPPWDVARFFSPGELTRLVRDEAGARLSLSRWRTTFSGIPWPGCLPLPWGTFLGMAVQLGPG